MAKRKKNKGRIYIGMFTLLVLISFSLFFTQKVSLINNKIGQIAANYIVDHPEVLIKASEKLEQQAQQARADKQLTNVKAHYNQLTDKATPYIGNPDGDVIVAEFFDYQCVFCSKMEPMLAQLMRDDTNLKFVKMETPIFAPQWSASMTAAQMGLYIYKNYGAQSYEQYHDAIFATGHIESRLTIADIKKAANSVGVGEVKFNDDIKNRIDDNLSLFNKFGFMGTPALIIMPKDHRFIDQTRVVVGADVKSVKSAIEDIRSVVK